MGLKRSLRNVSVGIGPIPDSVAEHMDIYYPMDEGSGTSVSDAIGNFDGTLDGAGWDTDPDSPTTDDEITIYDKDEEHYGHSDDTISFIGGSDVSAAIVLKIDDTNGVASILADTPSTGSSTRDGWALVERDEDRLQIRSGEEASNELDHPGRSNYFMFAFSADQTDLTGYMYDESGFQDELTITDDRSTSTNHFLNWMGGADNGFVAGSVAVLMAADGTTSRSAFDEIHADLFN